MFKTNIILFITLLFFTCCRKENLNGNTPEEEDTTTVINNPIDTTNNNPVDTIPVQTPDTTIISQEPCNYFLYVSLDQDNQIGIYQIDTISGHLTFIEKISTAGSTGSLASDKNSCYLYAALRSTSQVASFNIDHKTGKLRFIQNTNVADNPVYITPDRSNRFLLTTYFAAGKVAIYPITGDSIVEKNVIQEFDVGINPHCIINDPDNQFTYVSVMTVGHINQYAFSSSTGILTALSPDKINLGENIGPRHISFHPNKKWVYIVNEISNTVFSYYKDTVSGILTKFDEINTLPASFISYSKCADIHVTPDGKFVYASNRGHNSITAFSIDPLDGHLTLIDQYETETYPREFEIEPGGRFLFAGGEQSGNIAAYTIHENGSLTKIETVQAGTKVTWLMSVRLPR